MPIQPSTDNSIAFNVINENFAKLDNESVTKVIKDNSGNDVMMGILPNGLMGFQIDLAGGGKMVMGAYRKGLFGTVWYDSTGTARILQGQSPDDGRIGTWISKPGQDVIALLGG